MSTYPAKNERVRRLQRSAPEIRATGNEQANSAVVLAEKFRCISEAFPLHIGRKNYSQVDFAFTSSNLCNGENSPAELYLDWR